MLCSARDNHHGFLRRCDRLDADAYAMTGYVRENFEDGKRLQIVATGIFREPDYPSATVARATRWIESHVAIARARSEDEEVDSPSLRQFLVERLRILRIRKPHMLVAQAVRVGQTAVERSSDFCAGEIMA